VISAYLSTETLLPFSTQLEAVYVRRYLIVTAAQEAFCPQVRATTLKEMRRLGQKSCHSR
jgi:hypothetical protein